MEHIGWLTAIFVGGIAGWLAGKLMEMRFGIFMNIIIGVVGSAIANMLLERLDIFVRGDWVGYLITSFTGACILLFLAKLVRK